MGIWQSKMINPKAKAVRRVELSRVESRRVADGSRTTIVEECRKDGSDDARGSCRTSFRCLHAEKPKRRPQVIQPYEND